MMSARARLATAAALQFATSIYIAWFMYALSVHWPRAIAWVLPASLICGGFLISFSLARGAGWARLTSLVADGVALVARLRS